MDNNEAYLLAEIVNEVKHHRRQSARLNAIADTVDVFASALGLRKNDGGMSIDALPQAEEVLRRHFDSIKEQDKENQP